MNPIGEIDEKKRSYESGLEIKHTRSIKQKQSMKPLIRFENATLRVRDRKILQNTNWWIYQGQHWAVIGPNGAGKSTLARAMTGEVSVVGGKIEIDTELKDAHYFGYVSFELERSLMEKEDQLDAGRYFSGNIEQKTTVRKILFPEKKVNDHSDLLRKKLLSDMGFDRLLNKGLRALSNGEIRKMLIARALLKVPKILILDEPFEGLDKGTKTKVQICLSDMVNADKVLNVVIITHRFDDLPEWITHVLLIDQGRVVAQGKRGRILGDKLIHRVFYKKCLPFNQHHRSDDRKKEKQSGTVLVRMENVQVRYGSVLALGPLTWTMRESENWAIVGPNGCGKTTLLNLITGDHPQVYSNHIEIFGKKRGVGETIWDIKHGIGHVSAEFQMRYKKQIRAFDVILSGFFDTVGLYNRNVDEIEYQIAWYWINLLNIESIVDCIFDRLSYGLQRLILIARSMVKSPRILILDEPCQGLDQANRKNVLELIGTIGNRKGTNIVYVSHYEDEIPECITHCLSFYKTPPCSCTTKVKG